MPEPKYHVSQLVLFKGKPAIIIKEPWRTGEESEFKYDIDLYDLSTKAHSGESEHVYESEIEPYLEYFESDLFIDDSSDNFYKWARLCHAEEEKTAYLLFGASQEFSDIHDVETTFQEVIKSWKGLGDSIYERKFHYSPHATSVDGQSRILEFLKFKEKSFGY